MVNSKETAFTLIDGEINTMANGGLVDFTDMSTTVTAGKLISFNSNAF